MYKAFCLSLSSIKKVGWYSLIQIISTKNVMWKHYISMVYSFIICRERSCVAVGKKHVERQWEKECKNHVKLPLSFSLSLKPIFWLLDMGWARSLAHMSFKRVSLTSCETRRAWMYVLSPLLCSVAADKSKFAEKRETNEGPTVNIFRSQCEIKPSSLSLLSGFSFLFPCVVFVKRKKNRFF